MALVAERYRLSEFLQSACNLDFRVFRGLGGPDDQSLRKKTGRHLGPGTTKPSRQHASYDAAPR
jgi:hypothetical protein